MALDPLEPVTLEGGPYCNPNCMRWTNWNNKHRTQYQLNDLRKIKTDGIDKASFLTYEEMVEMLPDEVVDFILNESDGYKTTMEIMRWVIRGLSPFLSVKKVMTKGRYVEW